MQGCYRWEDGYPVALEADMTEANFSSKRLGAAGAVIISAWLSSGKDKGALSKLDVHSNRIPPTDQALLQSACDKKGVSLAL
jgi:hypothetical protein